jgi:hypothetical protein
VPTLPRRCQRQISPSTADEQGRTNINLGSPEPVNLGSSGDLVTVYAVAIASTSACTTHRFPTQSQLPGHRLTGGGHLRVVLLMLGDQANRPDPQLRVDLLRHVVILPDSERDGTKP